MSDLFPRGAHDKLAPKGFKGYDPVAEDPYPETAPGNIGDTYEYEKIDPTPDELHVLYRFERGEINREEAETLLGMLAADHDL